MRFGIVHSEIKFPFASALTFRYLCHSKIIPMKILFFQYPSCSTCKKAAKWLKDHDIDIESKHIVETPPTVGELTEWITRSNLPLQKFFNTSGQKYRELNLKNRISTIPEKELIELLASDGKLIKRPLLVTDSQVLVGFNAELWQDVLLSETK